MKKLPEIYKEIINVNNNRNVFYSKNNDTIDFVDSNKRSDSDNIKDLVSLGKYGYIKKVKITTEDRVYETRVVRRTKGKILTIDNDIIDEDKIISLEFL